jgi:IclR family transcriptional regulator, pca regulon regulatory protein
MNNKSRSTVKPDREYITSLQRGLTVLECFSRENPEMTISEISVLTSLNPAVVRRCLHTLQHLGYVGKKGKLFLLRPQVMNLGSAYLESTNVEEAFRPTLQELSDLTGDSASLSVLMDDDIIFLVYVSTIHTIHYYVGVGKRCPAYVTALGRALLAYQPKEDLEEYYKRVVLRRYTDKTVSSVTRLKSLLSETRRQGYCVVQSELDPQIISIAMPVFNTEGQAVAAINCSTSTTRANTETIMERLPALREAARKIEMELRRYPSLVHSIGAEV